MYKNIVFPRGKQAFRKMKCRNHIKTIFSEFDSVVLVIQCMKICICGGAFLTDGDETFFL